jgi:hypothetical protein
VNRLVSFAAFAFVLFGSEAHLPAPIIEPSPAPSERPNIANHKSATGSAEENKQSPFNPFVGVWIGNLTVTVNNDTTTKKDTSTKPGSLVVAKDGNVNWGSNGHHAKALLSSDNRELHWSYQNFDEHGDVRWNCSLRLVDPKTASYQGNGTVTSPFANATMTASATFTKR